MFLSKQRTIAGPMGKSKAFILVATVPMLLMALNPGGSTAHTASNLILEYDFANQDLNATVTHVVANPNTHYISEAVINKNGAHFDTQVYVSQPTGSTFKYNYSVPAVDGDILEVRVTCNNFGTLTNQITVVEPPPPTDTEDPTIDITSPTTGLVHNTDSTPVSISGTASDNVGVTSVTWSNNATGGSGSATGTDTWSATVSLSEGENNITVTASDAAGNTGSDNLTIIYIPATPDTTNPTISITTQMTGQTLDTDSTPVTIEGTASDDVDVASVTWENAATGGSGTGTGTSSWSVSIPLAEGQNEITITVSDPSGNTASESFTVNYEIPEPPTEREEETPLWVYHAILMSIGFVLLLLAVVISTAMRKKKWWLKVHKSLGILGAIFAILGLIMGLYMVSNWGTPHFRVPHAILGIITIILAMVQPALGFVQSKSSKIKPVHRWLGRTVVILMFVSILAGLNTAGII